MSARQIRRASKLPLIAAHPLRERQKSFDDPDWLFKLKYDGYRALLYFERGRGQLISRNGRHMKRFDALASALVPLVKDQSAILDGEIVVKDTTGRPIFLDLMPRRDDASCVASDLVWLDGRNLRRKPLLERKRALGRIIPRRRRPLIETGIWLYGAGSKLFELVIDHDLEGIVAKRKDGAYSASTL